MFNFDLNHMQIMLMNINEFDVKKEQNCWGWIN